jgi:hypothetical protein
MNGISESPQDNWIDPGRRREKKRWERKWSTEIDVVTNNTGW